MDVALRVALLGSLAIQDPTCSDSPPVLRFRTRKTAALFAFLAFHAGVPQPREELIERFWSDTDLDAGRMSLRTALSSLRKDFGEALEADKTFVTLRARTDVHRFESALRGAGRGVLAESEQAERFREAADAYGGPLLPGFYEDWVLQERDRLAAAYQGTLTFLMNWHETRGERHLAIAYARRAAVANPLSEKVRADLIRLLKEMGRPDEARRQFDDLERLLEEQLGMKPTPALQALVAEIARRAEVPERESAPTVHLPASRGRFRGRQDLLATLVQRLSGGKSDGGGASLFTLLGPGGIGKTRLAIEAARRLAAHGLIDAVWFVPLVTATDEDQVWETILQALDLARSPALPAAVQVAARLARTETSLLVLDNLDQITLEAGEVAMALLARVPGLTVLTTSRRRLGMPAEVLLAVGALVEKEAIALFLDRARSVVPNFMPTGEEKTILRQLIYRLEGFPLGIELAATWIAALSPADMLAQLEAGLLPLAGRSGGKGRHGSLAATIAWSVDLLGADLQRAFRSLSIFRGGWDAAAARAICGVDRDALASLRDRSLLLAQTQDEGIRFDLYEALREFGAAALSAAERTALSRQHAGYFVAFAEAGGVERLEREQANLRAALDAADAVEHRRLVQALAGFWDRKGHWREARRELERALAGAEDAADQAELLHQLGRTCYNLCDYEASQSHHEAALALCQAVGDDRRMGRATHALASLTFHRQPDLARSRALTERSLDHFTRAGDVSGQTQALIGLGVLETAAGDYAAARGFQRRSLEAAEAAGLPSEKGIAHWRLGASAMLLGEFEESERQLRLAEGCFAALQEPIHLAYVRCEQGVLAQNRKDHEKARALYESAMPLFQEVGEMWACAVCLGNLARLSTATADYARAAAQWEESLRIRTLLEDGVSIVAGLDGVASLFFCVAAERPDLDLGRDAVRLRAAGAAQRMALGIGPAEAEDQPAQEESARAALGAATSAEAEREGAALSLRDAQALAKMRLGPLAGEAPRDA